MIKHFVKILELLGDRLEVCVSVYIYKHYISGIQKEVRRLIRICIRHMSNSTKYAKMLWSFIFMQYTNNILDLFITFGCNIQSVSAYRSTGMELRFFNHSGSTW